MIGKSRPPHRHINNKVIWATGAYAAMQSLETIRTSLERQHLRDFILAIARRDGRNRISRADVEEAIRIMYPGPDRAAEIR